MLFLDFQYLKSTYKRIAENLIIITAQNTNIVNPTYFG